MAGSLTLRRCSTTREETGATVSLDYGPSPAPDLGITLRVSVPQDFDRVPQLLAAVRDAAIMALAEAEWPGEMGGAQP